MTKKLSTLFLISCLAVFMSCGDNNSGSKTPFKVTLGGSITDLLKTEGIADEISAGSYVYNNVQWQGLTGQLIFYTEASSTVAASFIVDKSASIKSAQDVITKLDSLYTPVEADSIYKNIEEQVISEREMRVSDMTDAADITSLNDQVDAYLHQLKEQLNSIDFAVYQVSDETSAIVEAAHDHDDHDHDLEAGADGDHDHSDDDDGPVCSISFTNQKLY